MVDFNPRTQSLSERRPSGSSNGGNAAISKNQIASQGLASRPLAGQQLDLSGRTDPLQRIGLTTLDGLFRAFRRLGDLLQADLENGVIRKNIPARGFYLNITV